MSNSPLVSYTKISPNRTSPRNRAIDTITIHCVVGQCAVETIGNVFAPSSRQASSNYGIGPDGRIGMYVEEKDRSWCTSSAANDNRAVTIEVASDTTHPYAVKDAAYNALIELVADICRRNGIKKLVWSTDKSQRVNHQGGCNMTVHRDYAAKSCPGDYLYQRHGDIAAKVNAKLGASTTTATPTVPQTVNADKTIWDFLCAKGLNAYAAAGIMGNLYAESGLAANNLQNTGEKKLGMTDAQYTAAVDTGTYANFAKDGQGYGLAQWTYSTRKQALLDFAKAAKKSIGDLTMQLDFLWKEMQGYAGMMTTLRNSKSVREASDSFMLNFERPANQGETVKAQRAKYGQTYYDKYAGAKSTAQTAPAAASVPYQVKVTATALNVRKGPGTNYAITTTIRDKGVYTIVEEQNGWGRLKSGAGWISLAYTEKRS